MSRALVASGPAGLLLLGEDEVTVLDRAPTTGVAVSPSGDLLARLLYDPDGADEPGEVVFYDAAGLLGYRRVDELREAHGALWHDDELLVVSTKRNAVLTLDRRGDLLRRWQPAGAETGDCWHLNNLAMRDGRVLVSAFGRFATHRGWALPGARDGQGVVFDLADGSDVLRGLTCPHDPTPLDGGWLVCDSAAGCLLRLDHRGRTLQRVELGGWTRGLAHDERHVHVAVSTDRFGQADGGASVVTLDRATLAEISRRPVPGREVFALTWLPPALLDGLLRRPRSPTSTPAVHAPPVGGPAPLRPDDCSVSVVVREPAAEIAAATPLMLGYEVTNLGSETLASLGSTPVHVGARWVRAATGAVEEESRDRLAEPLVPRASLAGTLELWTPAHPGEYVLRVSVVQEHVHWFDDLDAANGWERRIEVLSPDSAARIRRTLPWPRRGRAG